MAEASSAFETTAEIAARQNTAEAAVCYVRAAIIVYSAHSVVESFVKSPDFADRLEERPRWDAIDAKMIRRNWAKPSMRSVETKHDRRGWSRSPTARAASRPSTAAPTVSCYCPHLVWLNLSWPSITELPLHELGGSQFRVSSMERRCRPPDMSNFCCLPGRAGGTPIEV